MKSLVTTLLHKATGNDFIWNALNATVVRTSEHLKRQRQTHTDAKGFGQMSQLESYALKLISPCGTVQHGPFMGMKYPAMKSAGSALVPKLLGSYEKEIQPIIELVCRKKYSEIVDIGCAEGYYAVGLAMRINTAKVFAFDTDERAVSLCMQMAIANDVVERVAVGGFCSPEILKSFPFTGRGLVVSDCEGFEKVLFTKEMALALSQHDVLIETHDFRDITISDTIREAFQATHTITAIQSMDDITKARDYHFFELEGFTLAERYHLLGEGRPSIMEWLFMTSLQ